MLGVRHRLVDLRRDLLDRALTLSQQVDDLGPPPAGQRLCHLGKAVVQRVLGRPLTHVASPSSSSWALVHAQTNPYWSVARPPWRPRRARSATRAARVGKAGAPGCGPATP